MVDALHRAMRLLRCGGRILDIHPTPDPGFLAIGDPESGGERLGVLEAQTAWARHASADDAVRTVVSSGALGEQGVKEFPFRRYGESIEELSAYVAQKWTDAHFSARTVDRVREAHAAHPRASLWLEERVRMTRLVTSTVRSATADSPSPRRPGF
jgi:hypothetical protein